MPPSSTPAPHRPRNRDTILPTGWTPPSVDAIDGALALAATTLEPDRRTSDRGAYVFVAHRGQIQARFLPAGPMQHLVVGRHEECDLRLTDDPTLSLRHLLVATTSGLHGEVATRVLDLSTPRPFVLPDGSPQRSLVASGAFAVAVGTYVVGVVPSGPSDPGEDPKNAVVGPYRTAMPLSAVGERRSRITAMRRSRLITDLNLDQPTNVLGRLTLWRPSTATESIVLSRDALEHGVLIGRAERCLQGGLEALMTRSISRVHMLLLHHAGRTMAYDLASTQGTYEHGRRVRALVLGSATATAVLGQYDGIQLTWRPGP